MVKPHTHSHAKAASAPSAKPARKHAANFTALVASLLFTATAMNSANAAVLDYVEVGPMYMAYFNLDGDQLAWTNRDDYPFDGPQVLRPLSDTQPGDYYAASVPAASLLNPHTQGGMASASSRLFGFSLSGSLRSYLAGNGYAIAIGLSSITYAGTQTEATNAGVYYYNRGNDDWNTYHADKAEWSELTGENYLLWNGQSFSNMIHPLVFSLDDFPAEYTLTYTLSIVNDTTGENINATVVDSITAIAGTLPLTISYNAQSLGATPVPEPGTYALGAALAALAVVAVRQRNRRA